MFDTWKAFESIPACVKIVAEMCSMNTFIGWTFQTWYVRDKRLICSSCTHGGLAGPFFYEITYLSKKRVWKVKLLVWILVELWHYFTFWSKEEEFELLFLYFQYDSCFQLACCSILSHCLLLVMLKTCFVWLTRNRGTVWITMDNPIKWPFFSW